MNRRTILSSALAAIGAALMPWRKREPETVTRIDFWEASSNGPRYVTGVVTSYDPKFPECPFGGCAGCRAEKEERLAFREQLRAAIRRESRWVDLDD